MRESEGKRKRKGEREQDRERDKRELLGVRWDILWSEE